MADLAASNRFQTLVGEFSQAMQLPYDRDAEVLLIVAGDLQAFVRPHPLDADRIAVIVELASLGTDDAASRIASPSLLLLHRLNHRAWTEHGWQILIDDQNTLGIRACRDLESVTAAGLEDWIVEGLERAQVLADLWRDAIGQEPRPSEKMTDWRSQAFGLIRG